MLHISWWFLLSGLTLYIIYFIIGIIAILLTGLVEYIILKIQVKKGKKLDKYESKATKLLDMFETKKLERIFIILQVSVLICIPVNNLIYSIRMNLKDTELRLMNNKKYLNNNLYHYYKVVSLISNSTAEVDISRNVSAYYTFSTKTLEEIKNLPTIKIRKNMYVKPMILIEVSKEEFLKNTQNLNLEKEF